MLQSVVSCAQTGQQQAHASRHVSLHTCFTSDMFHLRHVSPQTCFRTLNFILKFPENWEQLLCWQTFRAQAATGLRDEAVTHLNTLVKSTGRASKNTQPRSTRTSWHRHRVPLRPGGAAFRRTRRSGAVQRGRRFIFLLLACVADRQPSMAAARGAGPHRRQQMT